MRHHLPMVLEGYASIVADRRDLLAIAIILCVTSSTSTLVWPSAHAHEAGSTGHQPLLAGLAVAAILPAAAAAADRGRALLPC